MVMEEAKPCWVLTWGPDPYIPGANLGYLEFGDKNDALDFIEENLVEDGEPLYDYTLTLEHLW